MKTFGGPAIFLDRSDINTDEIIPAKYLTEISKNALKPHLLEDLLLDGKTFDNNSEEMQQAKVVVTRSNFGCGSSREHAVWAFEVNDISVIIAEGYSRIFRQNMFNCGILAIELDSEKISEILATKGKVTIDVDVDDKTILVRSDSGTEKKYDFTLNPFDADLVSAGGWLAYADQNF